MRILHHLNEYCGITHNIYKIHSASCLLWMRKNTNWRFAFCANVAHININRATFRLNALIALCCTGQTRWSERKDGRMEKMMRLYVQTCCNRYNSTQRENGTTYCYSDRASWFLETGYPVSLPEGYTQYYERDLSWHKSQSLHRRCGGGGGGREMNYSTTRRHSALTSRVLWGGEVSRRQRAAPSHDMTSPGMEQPRNLDFPEDRASFQRAAVE